ncbi:MAG: ABC transporter substrate-binding protein [Intrasporangium sp.]|uniref:ABC transporter substrate-binding protein n=1 Tax=Intrasporangium sp. TaxID=1925024 RepID=UPI003F7E6EC1
MRVRRVLAGALASLAVTAAGACTSLTGGSAATDRVAGASPDTAAKGGDLHVLVAGDVRTWDPQLMYVGPEAFFAERTFVRTLTTYGTGKDQRELVGDLATTTGTPTDGGRTWSFTLRDGIAWQDGSPVTCDDVRHGVARTFDRTTHIAGTNYASFLLDVPTQVTAEGLEKPVYTGPKDTRNAAAFTKAVECKGQQITFHLREPEPDFPYIVSLAEFAPRKASMDSDDTRQGHAVMSTGPYRLSGTWDSAKGGTFVRNERWAPASDPVRKAYPDRIVVEAGLDESAVIQRLLNASGTDAQAVSWVEASPTLRNQASPEIKARMTSPWNGDVDYLALNMKSRIMSRPEVRQAFALATNRATYVTANGGPDAGAPTWSILPPSVSERGVAAEPGRPVEGDPEAARALLAKAGVRTPVKVRVVHVQSALGDKAYAALAAAWERAGFDVELNEVPPEKYYETIERPDSASKYDVFRGVWSPDWPSAGAILPALFDARINLDSSGPGQDVGYFSDGPFQALVDKATAAADPRQRRAIWEQADDRVREQGGYVALAASKSTYLHGPGVTHYEDHVVGGMVDLATAAVR